ncbi:hypothetical protein BGW37DRAFT_284269 [Umbelopsis sp. PMI_123]|nr:hypothetical protein BGW37DRAFT_284269 [Umbelopsis sp. PMI_123]
MKKRKQKYSTCILKKTRKKEYKILFQLATKTLFQHLPPYLSLSMFFISFCWIFSLLAIWFLLLALYFLPSSFSMYTPFSSSSWYFVCNVGLHTSISYEISRFFFFCCFTVFFFFFFTLSLQ